MGLDGNNTYDMVLTNIIEWNEYIQNTKKTT